MTNDSHGGTPADQTDVQVWADFEAALADYLGGMGDPSGEDHLILEVPGDDETGTAPYVQFAGFGRGAMLRAEVVSNTFLSETFALGERESLLLEDAGFALQADDAGAPLNWTREEPIGIAAVLANVAVFAIRVVFGIPHPQLLTWQAWGPAAERIALLGLSATSDVATESSIATSRDPLEMPLYRPESREELLELVGRVLAHKYDAEPVVDDDGDYVVRHGDHPLWVRVRSDQPAIEIMACLVHDVRSRRATAVELGILNKNYAWVKWEPVDRAVWQRLMLPGDPFVPAHLDDLLDVFCASMSATRDDLVLRTGGRRP